MLSLKMKRDEENHKEYKGERKEKSLTAGPCVSHHYHWSPELVRIDCKLRLA